MAIKTLVDTHFAFREQFPREIQEMRKPLYQEMKKAKDNGQKVKLVRDKLFIDNEKFVPRGQKQPLNSKNSSIRRKTVQINHDKDELYSYSSNRVFYNSNRKSERVDYVHTYSIPTSNIQI